MAKRRKENETYTNPAQQLHDILTALQSRASSGAKNQQQALCEVLHVPPDDAALFHTRLASLHRLPGQVRLLIERAGLPPRLMEWYDPVSAVLSSLHGGKANLNAFNVSANLPGAITLLYACAAMLGTSDCLELEELRQIREAIQSVLRDIDNASDLDPELKGWLSAVLRAAEDVIEEAEAAGVYAARTRLRIMLGSVRLKSCPPPATEAAKSALDATSQLVRLLVVAVDTVKDYAGLLTD